MLYRQVKDTIILNGVNPVPDSYYKASSEHKAIYATPKARLDGDGSFWLANEVNAFIYPETLYLQVSEIGVLYLLLFKQFIFGKVSR